MAAATSRMLVVAALLCFLPEAMGQLDFIENTTWTCPVPMEEETELAQTAAGRTLIQRLFKSVQNMTESRQRSFRKYCNDTCDLNPMIAGCNARCMGRSSQSCNDSCGVSTNVPVPGCVDRCISTSRDICNQTCSPNSMVADCRDSCLERLSTISDQQLLVKCGNFSLAEVADLCKDIPAGQFCVQAKDEAANKTCILYTDGRPAGVDCPDGFYCGGNITQPKVCKKGLYCPTASPRALSCPNGTFCPVAALSIECDEKANPMYKGLKCTTNKAGRTIMPDKCPKGEFCTDGRSSKCPPGKFCPWGVASGGDCSKLETCPAGSYKPGRLWASTLGSVLILLAVTILTALMSCWFLPRNLSWARIGLFAAIVIALWASEIPRPDRDVTVVAYLTSLWLGVAWGTVVSPRYRDMFGGLIALGIDFCVVAVAAVLASILAQDWMVGVFLITLFPAALLINEVFVDERASVFLKIGLVLFGLLATIIIIGAITRWATVGLHFIVLGAVVAETGVRTLLVWLLPARCLPMQRVGDALLERQPTLDVAPRSASRDPSLPPPHWTVETGNDEIQPEGFDNTGVSIEFRHVSLLLSDGRKILDDLSLQIPAGCSVAVMGPSGCGKSSITNVLSGRAGYGTVAGDIRINGGSDNSVDELRFVTGFVPQDDVMHRNLTVEENVTFQAEMRMPRSNDAKVTRAEQVDKEVDRVLGLLGLGDPGLRATRIGDEDARGVSGGQRKRVSIAMELVARPWLLFLDEPTSGLDSTTSHSVVDIITRAARESGCTTLAVIHQPRYETLLLFDRVVLLAAGGHLVYCGPSKSCQDYFEKVLNIQFPEKANPADTFMDAMTLESAQLLMRAGEMVQLDAADRQTFGKSLARFWRAHGAKAYGHVDRNSMKMTLPDLEVDTCTWGEAISVQFKRAFLQFRREWVAVVGNDLVLILGLAGLCLASPPYSEFDDIFHCGLALMLMMLTQGVAAQRIFGGNERPVAWREAGSSISTVFYFVGRDIAALVDIAVGALSFVAVYWPMSSLLVSQHNLVWTMLAFSYAVWGMNYIWSVALPSGTAQLLAVVASFSCFLIAGMNPSFNSLRQMAFNNGAYVMALSPVRWAHGFIMWKHMEAPVSPYHNQLFLRFAGNSLWNMGFPLQEIDEVNWPSDASRSFANPDQYSVLMRWSGTTPDMESPNAFVCSSKQLLMLGLYYRFVALMCLLINSKQRVHGGGQLLDTRNSNKVVGWSHLLRNLVRVFFVFFTHLQMALLLRTT